MPLLDIATAQPSLQNNLYTVRSQILYHGTFIFGSEKRLASSSWTSILISEKAKNFNVGRIEMGRGGLMIKAVATLEPNCSIQSNDGHKDFHNIQLGADSKSPLVAEHQSISEDSTEIDEKEKLRRMRISQANKGNTPWNKGRKHSPETLQRIRERTRLAMQDPKVKMKLVNLGHAQSKETRIKIGVGVRIGWERRRGKLMLQETCHFEWQKLIAEASRRGFVGEEELQWDSYKILDEQLEQEWLESVEQRKNTPRPKGSKRAPKSLEQRRKISAAIAAKWTDPVYRDRVYSGLSKYHGTPVGVEKPKRRPTGDRQPRKRSPAKKIAVETDKGKVQNQRSRLKRSNKPMYKDPLASSKLEMIKSIRARRAAAENKRTEAVTRAKLLIAEAEKAANALEVAAKRSPVARASLIESRKLIAEAIRSIESIDTEQADSHENGWFTSRVELNGLVNHVEKETEEKIEDLSQTDERKVNGNRGLASIENDITDFGFGKFRLQDLLDGKDEIDEMLPTGSYDHGKEDEEELNGMGSSDYDLPELELEHMIKQLGQQIEPNGSIIPNGTKSESTSPNNPLATTKKWVRGKLVEVAEGDLRG